MRDMMETSHDDPKAKSGFIYQANYGYNDFLRFILAIICGFSVLIAAMLMLFGITEMFSFENSPGGFENHVNLLLSFLAFYPALWVMQTRLHKREWRDLLTSAPTFRWKQLIQAGYIYGLALVAFTAFDWLTGEVTWVYDGTTYWSFFMVTLLLVPFQAASEEILLRGYGNQFLIRYLKNPWVVYVITSMIFASLHFANPEADSGYFYQYALLIFVAGFIACIVTHYTGGLEAAIGMHIFNNLVVFTVVGHDIPGEPTTTLLSLGEIQFSWFDTIIAVLFEFVVAFIVIWYLKRQQSRTILSANATSITP
ncbi:CPBP family intramembrane glutamic endopeptidase [Kordiimonas laminariae]|uniref:CPBP family intramembrane glutamic endopeptidase n=1 Tax=Kordiimonas laminariae TaxID=2917717 RepID=UPI001FF1CFF1|nr:type II CAAX endopeptidase family protein [Kordiimonas laminariae]MCK0068105.1 CPBP family intramembrane metalloprotease [Kordiimonas laminariae]